MAVKYLFLHMPIIQNKLNLSRHFAEATHDLTLLEFKIVLVMLAMLDQSDKDFHTITIPGIDLIRAIARPDTVLNHFSNTRIMNALAGIANKSVTINGEEMPLIEEYKYTRVYRSVIEFRFSDKLKPYLLQVKEDFITFRLKEVIWLKSIFSIKLFLLKKLRRSYTPAEFMRILGIGEAKDYPSYIKFILPQVRKDLSLDIVEKKDGRHVLSLRLK